MQLSNSLSLQLNLYDQDIVGADTIGTIIFTAQNLRYALQNNGAVTYFDVSGDTFSQAWYVGLAVFRYAGQ